MSTATAALVPPTVVPAVAARPARLVSGALLRVLLVELGAMTGFYLLVSVVPMYTADRAGGLGAGLSTGVLMFASVAGETVTPWLAARLGYRRMLVGGLLLLGAPALALPVLTGPVGILSVCAVRGLGFAVVVVAVGALVPAVVPEQRRGEGLGLVGVAGALPAVVALPLGVWLVSAAGYPVAFVAGALSVVVTVAAAAGLPDIPGDHGEAVGLLGGLRLASVRRPALVFAATAVASGCVVTFLPAAAADLAAVALLVQAAAATVTRWWAGRYVDRGGRANLLLAGALAVAAGMLLLAVGPAPVATLASMVLFGAGFGCAQAASLTAMLAGVSAAGFGTVSAVWNMAYDIGWGAGAVLAGLVVAGAGCSAGFATAGVLVLLVAVLARRRTTRPAR